MLFPVERVEGAGAQFKGCGYVEQIDGANTDSGREHLRQGFSAGEGAGGEGHELINAFARCSVPRPRLKPELVSAQSLGEINGETKH